MPSSKMVNWLETRKPLPLGVEAQQSSFKAKGKEPVRVEYGQCENVTTKCYHKLSQYR